MASPIPLISFTANKTFEVDHRAASVLSKLNGPIAVLAVCGRARQGKSWLLNQLLAKLGGKSAASGFQVGSTQRPCTKGIWLWSAPIQRTAPNGLKYNLVFLDCEGTDAFDQTKDYSTQIFSLGLLMSSMLIFNQLGAIDESSVEALSTVCEFAKLIRTKSTSTAGDQPEISPSFLWLLRDFHLQLQDGGRQLSPADYMEEVLAPKGHPSKDEMRASIKDLFPNRDCAALVRPLTDERQLAAMDRIPLSQLRPEFVKGLEHVIGLVTQRAVPKSILGRPMTGSALVAFAQACVKVLNQGGVPSLSTTWHAVLTSENQKALEAGMATYIAKMDGNSATSAQPVDELDLIHERALSEALTVFDQQAMGDAALRAEFANKLRAAAGDRFKPLKAARLAQADATASQLLSTGANKLGPILAAQPVDLELLNKQLTALLKEYDDKASGPSKYKRAAEFLVNTVVSGLAASLSKLQGTAATNKDQLALQEKELAQVRSQLAVAHQQIGYLQQNEKITKAQLVAAEASMADLRVSNERRAAELAAAMHSKQEAASESTKLLSKLEEAQRQAQSLRQQLDAAQANHTARQAETDGARRTLEEQTTQLKSQLAAALAQVEALTRELAARTEAQSSHEAAAEAARRQAEARAEEMSNLLRATQAENKALRDAAAAKEQSINLEAQRIQQELATARQATEHERARSEALQRHVHSLQAQVEALQQQIASQRPQQPTPDIAGRSSIPDADMTDAVPVGNDVETDVSPEEVRKRKRVRVQRASAPAAAQQQAPPAAVTPTVQGNGRRNARKRKEGSVSDDEDAQPAAGGTPFSEEKQVLTTRSPQSRSRAGASTSRAGARSGNEADEFAGMTVAELKQWLTDKGHEAAVHGLATQRPGPKKDDWVALARSKAS